MSEKVLLIDDDQDFLSIMSDRMEIRDIEVTTALSGEKALSLAENVSYDAIILDLNMPNMDGLQTLEKLKAINPDLQIILLTGHATVAKGIQAMKLGAADVMEKPVDINALTEKIKKAHIKKIMLVEKRAEEKVCSILGSKWF